jgi:formyl-CoA transferase
MGIVAYTGFEGSPPSKVGQSYPDFLASWTAVFSVLVALRHVRETGEGQWIDQSMYQLGVGTVPEPMLQTQIDGTEIPRYGNHHGWKSPSNLYRAAGEDRWIAISVDSDAKWRRLLQIMGRGDLESDDRFATVDKRRNHNAEVDEIVGAWTAKQDLFEASKLLQQEGIAAGPMMNARDLMFDEHLEQRRFYEPVDFGPDAGLRPLIGRPWKMRNTPIHIQKGAPDFADANRYLAKEVLGMSDEDVEALYAEGVLGDEPLNPPPVPTGPARSNTAVNEDSDYREKMARWLERRMPAPVDVPAK